MTSRSTIQAGCLAAALLGAAWTAGCRSGPPPPEPADRQFDLTTRAARDAFDQGNLVQSAELYRQAFERACLRDDSQGAGDACYSLAAVLARLREYDRALDILASYTSPDDSRERAQRLTLTAQILVEQGRYADAQDTLRAFPPHPDPDPPLDLLLEMLQGLIGIGLGDPDTARAHLLALERAAPPNGSPAHARLAAAIAAAEGRWTDAARLSDEEAGRHRDARNYAAMAEALARAGDSFVHADQPAAAADRFLRAGRSATLQQARLPADQWLQRAIAIGTASGNQAVCAEAARWRNRTQDHNNPSAITGG